MPIYEYECLECEKRFEELCNISERHDVRCNKCGEKVRLLVSTSISRDWFRPHWNEHLDTTRSIYVGSKKEYKRLCKDKGVMAKCLL